MPTVLEMVRKAMGNPVAVEGAETAFALLQSWQSAAVNRLPGMATRDRLAVRIDRGRSIEEAAAREYAYRWYLPLNQWINFAETDTQSDRDERIRRGRAGFPVTVRMTGAWPVPHAIGLDGVE